MTAEVAMPALRLSEDEQLLAKAAREFVVKRSPARRVRELRDAGDRLGFSPELWRSMAELGWVGLTLPEAYGGAGAPFFQLCLLATELGRELAAEPLVSCAVLGAQAVLLAGGDAQQRRVLPSLASGERLVALACFERHSRGNPGRCRATARRDGDGWRLDGEKSHVLDGASADWLVVSALAEPGFALFLVERDAPGVSVEPLRRLDGRGAANLRFAGVRLEARALLGEPQHARGHLNAVLDRGAIALSAEMLGGAGAVFERTVQYLKDRRQFGVPIGSFQALQHRAARLFVELALTRSAVLAAARAVNDDDGAVPRLASLAKARASETFVQVANEAVQMHGGIGMTDELDVGLYLKRARVAEQTLGDAAYHRQRWARLGGY